MTSSPEFFPVSLADFQYINFNIKNDERSYHTRRIYTEEKAKVVAVALPILQIVLSKITSAERNYPNYSVPQAAATIFTFSSVYRYPSTNSLSWKTIYAFNISLGNAVSGTFTLCLPLVSGTTAFAFWCPMASCKQKLFILAQVLYR